MLIEPKSLGRLPTNYNPASLKTSATSKLPMVTSNSGSPSF